MNDICFWMIRRKDTGEYFRPNRGPTWAKCGNWITDRGRGKAYGNIGAAKLGMKSWQGDYASSHKLDLELVRFKVVEEGVEA